MPDMPNLHLAWTLDDGPTSATPRMIQNFGPGKPATWFVQYSRLNLTPSFLDTYRGLIAQGHEVGRLERRCLVAGVGVRLQCR